MVEAPPTQLTGVEFLSCVDALVSRQIRLCEERFGAEWTRERFVAAVNVFVLLA